MGEEMGQRTAGGKPYKKRIVRRRFGAKGLKGGQDGSHTRLDQGRLTCRVKTYPKVSKQQYKSHIFVFSLA